MTTTMALPLGRYTAYLIIITIYDINDVCCSRSVMPVAAGLGNYTKPMFRWQID